MSIFQGCILFLILLISGWAFRNRSTTVLRLLTAHLNLTNSARGSTKGYEIARHVREYPDTWPEKYPSLFRLFQLIGLAAYFMAFVAGLIIVLYALGIGRI